jgi:1-acyl-sn-glycerol-3-phosphate acyltransferase
MENTGWPKQAQVLYNMRLPLQSQTGVTQRDDSRVHQTAQGSGMSGFDDIRPYEDSEVSDVLRRLLSDKDFMGFISKYRAPVLSRFFSSLVRKKVHSVLSRELSSVDSVFSFQSMMSGYVKQLISKSTNSFNFQGIEHLQKEKGYLFVSNHRDIAADSMFVDYALHQSGFDTVRIAIGDNLLQRPFATDLMRLNKSFIIKRSAEGAKNIYAALLQSSRYIGLSIKENHSVWIAQSEGRAKDGIDKTDPAIVKMFALSRRKFPGTYAELIRSMNIVPVSISYEYDPCDALKAKELHCIDNQGNYVKPEGEDLLSLVKGLSEFKGRVNLHIGAPLDDEFESPEQVAKALDRRILENYRLYPANYVALSRLDMNPYKSLWQSFEHDKEPCFSKKEKAFFLNRLSEIPMEHQPYLLKMYANPLLNIKSLK